VQQFAAAHEDDQGFLHDVSQAGSGS
jgi:hypothetical protein